MRYDISHLEDEGKGVAIQTDEALLLYAIVKVLNPKTIVEFGFASGYSAYNFLKAMSNESKLYSFDPSSHSLECASAVNDSRFKFIQKKGEDFEHSDIDQASIGMVFIDASHNFLPNVQLFKKIERHFSDECLIAIHDTGLFNRDFMENDWSLEGSFYVGEKGYAHRPQERMFVNWLKRKYPQYDQIHFHSMTVGRMGITILKKYKYLSLGGRGARIWLSVNVRRLPGNIQRILPKRLRIILRRLFLEKI